MSSTRHGRLFGSHFGKTGTEYVLGERIGSGAFGSVYRATDTGLERTVAVKVLKESDDEEFPEKAAKRFEREAQIVARLSHECTVRLYEFGRDADTGLLFMVFELVEGDTLSTIIDRDGAIEPLRTIEIVKKVLEALQEAHAHGIIHRDIKPGNIMVFDKVYGDVHYKDRVKVLDFGIGKFAYDMSRLTLTESHGTIGTPRYMAPEQMAGRAAESEGAGVREYSDIYSLGIVAYEMLTGECLYPGASFYTIGEMVRDFDNPVRLPEGVCSGAPGVRAVVEKMCEKDVSLRYQTTSEVLRDLEHLRTLNSQEIADLPRRIEGRKVFEAGPELERAAAAEPAAAKNDVQSSQRTLTLVAVALLMGMIGVAGLTYALWPSPEGTPVIDNNTHVAASDVEEGLPAALAGDVDSSSTPANVRAALDVVSGEAFAAIDMSRLKADARANELLEKERQEEQRKRLARERRQDNASSSQKVPRKTSRAEASAEPAAVDESTVEAMSSSKGEPVDDESGEAGDEASKERKKRFKRPNFWGVE